MRARRIIVLSAVCLILFTGCQAGKPSGDRASSKRYDRVKLRYGLEMPPGISADTLTPRTGESLAKAQLNLDQILDPLPRPAFLDNVDTAVPADEDTQPPLAAQKAYVAGRSAWRLGDIAEAKNGNDQAVVALALIGDSDQPDGICAPLDHQTFEGAEPAPRIREFVER